jgi:hypothetical protein
MNRSYILLIGFVVFLITIYKLSIIETIILVQAINEKNQKLIWLKEKEQELPFLKKRMEELELANTTSDSTSARDKLTKSISEFADNNNCLVTEIPKSYLYDNNSLYIQTNSFTVKGNFHNLLSLLYLMETKFNYVAKIVSAKFTTSAEIATKKKKLYLTFITQSYDQK